MSIEASRRPRFLGLAPDAMSAALLLCGMATSLGAASLGMRPRGTSEDAMLSAYERASWQISPEGGGLSSVLYLGHLLGPMLVLGALVHARARHREQHELDSVSTETDALPPAAGEDAPRTLHRISIVLPRTDALAILERARTTPSEAHRAIDALAEAIERAGELEHLDRVLDASEDASVVVRERACLERSVAAAAGIGAELASYRELETVPPSLAGDHAILSWVLVTQLELDPMLDLPARGRTHAWLTELIPLRPEETVLVDAFVTPRTMGADPKALARGLGLEPLRGRTTASGARAKAA
jgi:hypothetical protein